MGEGRIRKSVKNVFYGMIGIMINLIISFVAKSIFIRLLGVEYNGLNSLFSNILTVLNLAELGFASSIAYALYKPLKDGNEREISAIMNYFAKVYRIIALIVLLVGLAIIPVLQYLINEPIETLPFSINELRTYYSLYVINTVCSYLLAYKRTIITADQKAYLVSNADNISNIVLNILQIVLLYITKNYYAFLGIMIARTVVNNLIIHIVASKKYKYLNSYKKEKISKEEKNIILKNVRAMMLHKVGGVAIYGTTSIIISAFVGVTEAGMYGNYLMIVTNVTMFINIIFSSMTASIGNLCVENSKENQYYIFKKINYLACVIGVFCFSSYVALFQPFITIWIGKENLLSMYVVITISFSTLVDYLRNAVVTFKNAMGLFRQDRYKPLLEAGIGVGLAIGLSYPLGITGVILGYTLARLLFAVPIENYVLFKKGFNKSFIHQMLTIGVYIIFAFFVAGINYFVLSLISLEGIGGFIVKFILNVVFNTILIVAFTMRKQEFLYFYNMFISVVKKLKNKCFKR